MPRKHNATLYTAKIKELLIQNPDYSNDQVIEALDLEPNSHSRDTISRIRHTVKASQAKSKTKPTPAASDIPIIAVELKPEGSGDATPLARAVAPAGQSVRDLARAATAVADVLDAGATPEQIMALLAIEPALAITVLSGATPAPGTVR